MAHPQSDICTHMCASTSEFVHMYFIWPAHTHTRTHHAIIDDWRLLRRKIVCLLHWYWLEYCLVYIIAAAAGRSALGFEFSSFNCISTVIRKIARSLLISHKCECHSLCSQQSTRIVRIWIRSSATATLLICVFKVFHFAAIALIDAYSCSFGLLFTHTLNAMPVNTVWSPSRTFHRRPRFNGSSADATAEATATTTKKLIKL